MRNRRNATVGQGPADYLTRTWRAALWHGMTCFPLRPNRAPGACGIPSNLPSMTKHRITVKEKDIRGKALTIS